MFYLTPAPSFGIVSRLLRLLAVQSFASQLDVTGSSARRDRATMPTLTTGLSPTPFVLSHCTVFCRYFFGKMFLYRCMNKNLIKHAENNSTKGVGVIHSGSYHRLRLAI